MESILFLNETNFDLLGAREPEVYGTTTPAGIEEKSREEGGRLGVAQESFQSNHEGTLIDRIQQANGRVRGALFDPGGLAQSSVALRDAIAAVDYPVIEVHLSNTLAREPFRRRDLVAALCRGVVVGLGPTGYLVAPRTLVDLGAQGSTIG